MKGKAPALEPVRKQVQDWFAFEGQRHTYQLFEKKTRLRAAGWIRTVVFVGEDGQQIPVLTNLAATAKPAKLAHCLRLRWRRENSFNFLSENYAIDQIIQDGADPETQDRRVPNPKRKALNEEARLLAQQIESLQGLKIAQADPRRQIAQKRQTLARIESRLRHTPSLQTLYYRSSESAISV